MPWRLGEDWGVPVLVNEHGQMATLNHDLAPWVIPLPQAPEPIDRGTPHKCPVCGGEGTIRKRLDDGQQTSAVTYEETCPTCHGERVLWSKALPQTTTDSGTFYQWTGDDPQSFTGTSMTAGGA